MRIFLNKFRFLALLLGLIAIIASFSCKRLIKPEPDEANELLDLTYQFTNYETLVEPFQSNQHPTGYAKLLKSASDQLPRNPIQGELMYYWNFNSKTIDPDFAITSGATITFQPVGSGKHSLDRGFDYPRNPNDYAVKIEQCNSFRITIEPKQIVRFSTIEFDFSANNLGPKEMKFMLIGDGKVYDLISAFTIHRKGSEHIPTSYRLNLEKVPVDFKEMVLVFNLSSENSNHLYSVAKIDNIRLFGHQTQPYANYHKKLNYFFINQLDQKVSLQGQAVFTSKAELSLKLLPGSYWVAMVFSETSKALEPMKVISKGIDLKFSPDFADQYAKHFGILDSFKLDAAMNRQVMLTRLFNQITFDFIDLETPRDGIDKITITPIKSCFNWVPLRQLPGLEIVEEDIKPLVFTGSFKHNHKIVFHHFMGITKQEQLLHYKVEVYKADQIWRTFQVKALVKNNVRVTFKGPLVPPLTHDGKFETLLNEVWAEDKQVDYNGYRD